MRIPYIEGIERALPPMAWVFLSEARFAAEAAEVELWLVGGVVRNYIFERPLVDLDVAVSDRLDDVIESIGGALRMTEVTMYKPTGTATVQVGGSRLDIATLRTETYEEAGAFPAVTFGATVEQDMARRDFTVNAVAVGVVGARRGEVVDPFNGITDAIDKVLRVLHPASFFDDPSRIKRGARFAQEYGLRPDATVEALLRPYVERGECSQLCGRYDLYEGRRDDYGPERCDCWYVPARQLLGDN